MSAELSRDKATFSLGATTLISALNLHSGFAIFYMLESTYQRSSGQYSHCKFP